MHRGPSTTQVVVICTSAVVRRMSCLWKVGSAPGPSDITTRFFAHLRRPIGTVVLISELSPVVANRTVPRGASGEPWLVSPSRLDAGWAEAATRATRPSATPTPIAVRRPPLLLTARVYERNRGSGGSRGRLRGALGPRRKGELDPHVRASAVGVASGRGATVGLGDGLHDREPEAGSLGGSGGVGAPEALERMRQELGREPAALVADVDLDSPVLGSRPNAHRPLPMAQRVLDEVPECLLDAHAVALDCGLRGVVEPQRPSVALRAVAQPLPHGREQV